MTIRKFYGLVFQQSLPGIKLKIIVLDVEVAAWRTVRSVFGEEDQAVWYIANSLGLHMPYMTAEPINISIHHLLALPSLPAQHILIAFEKNNIAA